MASQIVTLQDNAGNNLYPQVKWAGVTDFPGFPKLPTDYLKQSDVVVHDWSDTGLALLNGAQKRSDYKTTNTFQYSYIQFKGFKLVTLCIHFSHAQTANSYVQLPSNIIPNGNIMQVTQSLKGTQSAGLYVGTDGKISVLSPIDGATKNSLYVCTVTYLRKD